jgi:hypothetical protein
MDTDVKKLEQEIKKEESKKEETKKEEPKREDAKKDEAKKEEPAKKQETKTEEIKKEEPKKDEIKKELNKKEEPKKDDGKIEEIKKELPKKEDPKKEEIKKEDAKNEDKKNEDKDRTPDNKKAVIEEEKIVIKDEEEVPTKKPCCKNCCRDFGRCIVRFLYCLFSDRAMIFVNCIAVAAILVSIGERLSWAKYDYIKFADRDEAIQDIMKSPEFKENTSAFYYILVTFIIIFSLIFLLAEFRLKKTRESFSMLDTKGGRGFFLIFLGMMIPQNKNGVAIAMSVITNMIGILNIIVGYD